LILGATARSAAAWRSCWRTSRDCIFVIAGRSRAQGRGVLQKTRRQGRASALAFDREGDVEKQLTAAAPRYRRRCIGPVQAYGDAYRVVRACIATACIISISPTARILSKA